MHRKVVAVWVSLLIMASSIVILVEIAERVEGPYISHDPIRINNNAEFASMAVSEGWAGDGSLGNPYIIEGYDINGSGYGYCIYIGNTTVHFKIKDSYMHEANGVNKLWYFPNSGIILYYVQNGTIANNNVSSNELNGILLYGSDSNTIINNNASKNRNGIDFWLSSNNNITNNNASNNQRGIYLYGSMSNTIVNNTAFSNNGDGIHIGGSSYSTITNNIVSSNNGDAINIYGSSNITITNNEMVDNGIFIWGFMLEHWNSHIIETTNIVNGKPVYYWKNQTGGTVPLSAGQVILANCTNVIVENQDISYGVVGIELGYSNNNIVANNIASNYEYGYSGIYLESSSNNTIYNNNVSKNADGILLINSNDNIITNNTASNNGGGIHLVDSSGNTITNNNFSTSEWDGILLINSDDNTITNNNASLNNGYGIYFESSSRNIISNNTVSNNGEGISFIDSSDNNIYHNNIINNTDQADDYRWDNYWDNGYPFGGNYWSDYIGVDNFKGPNQDMPGSDGIGDSLYTIDSDSKDYYPLMEPGTFISLENSMILRKGWNLISIPLIQGNQSLKKVLEMIEGWYNAVQWYDSTDISDLWKHNKIGKPFGNDLFELNETMSFWIHITNPGDTIFVYNGTAPSSNQTIQLHLGWNMVGYPSLSSYNRTTGLNNLTFDTHVDAIQWYDAGTKSWHFMGPDDNFVPGRGYWVHSKVEAEWEVPL